MASQPQNQRQLIATHVRATLGRLRKLTAAEGREYAGVVARSPKGGTLIERVIPGVVPTAEMRRRGILGSADIHKAVAALPPGHELQALFHTHPGAQPKGTTGAYDPFSSNDHDNTLLYGVPHYVVEGDGRMFVDLLNPFGGGTKVFWEGFA